MKIQRLPPQTNCPWLGSELFPNHVCPILYHTLYPYFLALLYGAKFTFNEQGDCNVACPAEFGVDTIVKMRKNDGSYPKPVPDFWRDVIHAEVVSVHGTCPYNHKVKDVIVFPTCAKEDFACPAGINNVFPFVNPIELSCINRKRLRCPDSLETNTVYYSVKE